jgi:hypothetical protein
LTGLLLETEILDCFRARSDVGVYGPGSAGARAGPREWPHRAVGRKTPQSAFVARPRAVPHDGPLAIGHFRTRRDVVDTAGKVTLRHNSKLHHIGLGRRWAGTKILLLVQDLSVRIITEDGELVRELTLDPTRDYQANPGLCELCLETGARDVSRHHSVRAKGLEPPPPKGPGPKPAGKRPGMSVQVRESPRVLGICELASVAVPVHSGPSVHFG